MCVWSRAGMLIAGGAVAVAFPSSMAGCAASLRPEPAFETEPGPTCGILSAHRGEHTESVGQCRIAPVDDEVAYWGFITVLDRTSETVTKAAVRLEGGHLVPSDCCTYEGEEVIEYTKESGIRRARLNEYWGARHVATVTAQGAELVKEPTHLGVVNVSPTIERKITLAASTLLMPIVGWPGKAIAAGRWSRGARGPALEGPVERIVDWRLHGRPTSLSTTVRFQGWRPNVKLGEFGQRADALVFDVVVHGVASGGEVPSPWVSEALASGELLLRAEDGAFLALHLKGTLLDTETDEVDSMPRPTGLESRKCNLGDVVLDVYWSTCVRNR